MGRCFYNWTFIPYAMYALSSVLIAYMYFNRQKDLSVAASLTPLFGDKVTQGIWVILVDVLSVLAIELPGAYQSQQFVDPDARRSSATAAVLGKIGKQVPLIVQDMLLHPHIEYLKDFIHSGELIRVTESVTGELN